LVDVFGVDEFVIYLKVGEECIGYVCLVFVEEFDEGGVCVYCDDELGVFVVG